MKRHLRLLLLAAVLTAALCVSALAAEPTKAGLYGSTGNSVTLTPQRADGTEVDPTAQGGEYGGYYVDAVRFGVEKTGLTDGAQYLLLVVKGIESPSEKNIVYIDQKAADSNGKVSFNAYPSSLTKDNYRVYVVGEGSAYSQGTPTASFRYYQPYTLGDVDGDNYWTANDALYTLQIAVNKSTLKINGIDTPVSETMRLSADTDKDSYITANDALLILQKAVGKNVF